MAIDTREKRASAAQAIAILTMPNPSGVIGVKAREHATWLYSGISAAVLISGRQNLGDLYWSRNEA